MSSTLTTFEGDDVLEAAISEEVEAEPQAVDSGWRRIVYGVLANRSLTITARVWSYSCSSRSRHASF